MSNNTIKGAGDVYEKDLYADLGKSAKEVLPLLEAINDIFVKQSKNSEKVINIEAKDIKSIDKLNQGLEDTNNLFTQKIALDKQRVKVQRDVVKQEKLEGKAIADLDLKVTKLSDARAELIKRAKEADKQRRRGNDEIAKAIDLTTKEQGELAELSKELLLVRTERTNLNKEQKKIAQSSLGLLDIYQEESKRLNELRKELKVLILTKGADAEATKKLGKEVKDLDKQLKEVDAAAGQFQRNVGNYPDVADDAGKSTKELTKDLAKLAAGALAAKVTWDGYVEALKDSGEASEELRLATAALEGGTGEVKNVAAAATLDIVDLFKEVKDGNVNVLDLTQSLSLAFVGLSDIDKSATNVRNTFKRTTEATTDFTDKVIAAAKAEIEAEKRTIAFEKAIRPLEISISKLNKVIAIQNQIAGNTTKSFNEIETAAVKAQDAQIKRANILIKIAKEELAIIRIRLNARREAGKNVEELLDQETAAIIKLQDARTEAAIEDAESQKLLAENRRDRFERELDFAIDAFDAQKTVNERIIANDKVSLEKRRALLDETIRLTDKSFQSQIKLLGDFTKQKIDLDALVLESDEEVIRQKLRNFNFDDVTLGRILEIIKERKLALQDLTDAQVDLNDKEQDAIDIRKDILAQEEALGKQTAESAKQSQEALDNLEKDRESNNIENLRRRLDIAKEGSVEALNIQKELNDALLSEQEKRIQEQIDAEEKGAEERLAIQKALLDGFEKAFISSSQKRVEELGKEVTASEKEQARLRELADKGVLNADKSLAAEEKKQAELERQAAEEKRKQELVSAGFKIFSALLDQGKSPQEAVLETGVLLEALPAIIEAIPAFYEGTNTTVADSLGKPHLKTKKDGYLIRADGKEKILNPSQSARTGNMTTEEITNAAQMYDRKMLNGLHLYNQPKVDRAMDTNWLTNMQVMSKFDSLQESVVKTNMAVKKAIEDKPELTDMYYNRILSQMITVIESKGKKTTTTSKINRLS